MDNDAEIVPELATSWETPNDTTYVFHLRKGEADLTGPISPAAKKWALPVSEYPSYVQNTAKAKALLAEAGYPNGFKAVIKTANSYNYMIDTAVAIQNQLKAVGISTEITLVEWGQYVDDWKKGNNEMMVGLSGSGTTPDRALHFFFHSTGTANVWGFKNSKFDELVEKARVTLDDKKRYELYAEGQRMLVNEFAPNLFLASPYQFYVATKNVYNFTPSAILGESVFRDVWLDKWPGGVKVLERRRRSGSWVHTWRDGW